VADAFATVPRERFVPPMPLERVYRVDEAIPTRFDEEGVSISSSSAPSIMAVMLEMLEVAPGQRVLEIGTGTGYNAALLARLVGSGGSVWTIDIDPTISDDAVANLAQAGVEGVRVVTGDGWLGQPGQTFDRMMATAECWDVAPAWVQQLAEGGFLILPMWLRPGLSLAVAFEKTRGALVSRSLCYCGFMPLRGPHGGPPRRALVPDVPWDGEIGDDGDDAGDRGDSRRQWIALFDDANAERIAVLRSLLRSPGSVRPTPATFPGWNLRLVLEHPDPICVITLFPPLRDALGLFDAELSSLAVIEGGLLHCFGHPSCADRLERLLSSPRTLALSELSITAVPHGSPRPKGAMSVMERPDHDFVVQRLPQ
jgi:protein-L-isoaspartate(D-aspartate) O-methyltransferase